MWALAGRMDALEGGAGCSGMAGDVQFPLGGYGFFEYALVITSKPASGKKNSSSCQ